MILIAHIAVALSSVVFSAYVLLSPSQRKLRVSYTLIALTLASGTYLVFMNPAHMTQTCITGLIYVGVVTACTIAARYKLARFAVT